MAPTRHASGFDACEPRGDSRNNVALVMIGGAFVGVFALTAPFVAMQLRSSLPYMATPRGKVERALTFVSRRLADGSDKTPSKGQSTWKNGKQLNFVDLGSGDGTAVLAAASLGWNAAGLELNPTLWLASSLRRLFSPRSVRTNSAIILGDMFASENARGRLRHADCVMIFGVRPLMPRIAELVGRECRPGCLLMSYRFRVPLSGEGGGERRGNDSNRGKDDRTESSSSGGIDADLIYDEEEMRIYRLGNEEEE